MTASIEAKKDNFLTDQQKSIKQMIMDTLLTTVGNYTFLCFDKFDHQAYSDLILSIIIMFSREMISRTVVMTNNAKHREEVIDVILKTIREESLNQIEELIEQNKKTN